MNTLPSATPKPDNIVNISFESLEQKDVKLSNGSIMDLYNLKKDAIIYGISIEGDDYVNGPLFYGAYDAVLNALTRIYIRDTIGFNNNSTIDKSNINMGSFVFNSMIRIREYNLAADLKFYDARNQSRPFCSDVGINNFKTYYELKLPFSKKQNILQSDPAMELSRVLSDVITGQSELMVIQIECLTLCDPGKYLRIRKSLRLDMATLWKFYGGLIVKNNTPVDIRNKIFMDPNKFNQIIGGIIQDKQVPSAVSDLPVKIIEEIKRGKSLELLSKENAGSQSGQQIVISGPFFKRLWERDVKSIYQYISQMYFLGTTGYKIGAGIDIFRINPEKLGTTNTLKPINPYITNWMFEEDLMLNMGYDSSAYSWNYNRYLDLNTVMWFIINSGINNQNLIDTPLYEPKKHLNSIPHRFTDDEASKLSSIDIYDYLSELKINISVDKSEIIIKYEIIKIKFASRAIDTRNSLKKWLSDYTKMFKGKIATSDTIDAINKNYDLSLKEQENRHALKFTAPNMVISGISLNWYVIFVLSSLLRLMVTKYDMSVFVFNM